MQRISLMVYIYLVTKCIDLEFYVRLLMYGHQILHHFEKMSLFITRSCINQEIDESSGDETIIDDRSNSDFINSQLLQEDTDSANTHDQLDTTTENEKLTISR